MDRRSFLAGTAAAAGAAAMGLPMLAPGKEQMVSVLVAGFPNIPAGTGYTWQRITFSKMVIGDVVKFDDEGDREFRVMKAPFKSEHFTHDGKPIDKVELRDVGDSGLERRVTARMSSEMAKAYKDILGVKIDDWRIL